MNARNPLEALKVITINAAYQYCEEKATGFIEVGKLEGCRRRD
jgi:predicted amidohydrolase YtcJ